MTLKASVSERYLGKLYLKKNYQKAKPLKLCTPGLDTEDNIYYIFVHDLNDGMECSLIKFAYRAKFKIMADPFRRTLKSLTGKHPNELQQMTCM